MTYQIPELLDYPQLLHAFSIREAGNMSFKWGNKEEVISNRQQFLAELKIEPTKVVSAELVQGDTILRVGKKHTKPGILKPPSLKTDGLITNEPGIFLFHVVADCLSLLFYDPKNQVVGLAHAGWQGTELEIAKKMVEKLTAEFKTQPTDLIVGFGPAIHQCCFAFLHPEQEQTKQWRPFLRIYPDGLTHINNLGFNLYQLSEVGVEHENIFISEFCTAHSGKFFSHYQNIKDKKPEARFAALIGLK